MDPVSPPTAADAAARTAELFQLGGPVLYVLLAMSIVALAIVLVKLYQFAAMRVRDRAFVPAVLQHYAAGRTDEAMDILHRRRGPVAAVMEVAVEGRVRRDVDESIVREEVERVAANYVERLRSYLRGLELIATLSPLLGLFGTVLGMIEAFQELEQAGNRVNPSILSGGIWEALLTTAAGLGVAIPALFALNWLERGVQRVAHAMEDAVTQVFTAPLQQQPWRVGTPRLHATRSGFND